MKLESLPAVKSASRVLDLLERLADAERPLSFIELSRELRIPKSSLFHLLADLTTRGYVEHMPEIARYCLGGAILTLARRSGRGQSLAELVTPVLRRLNAQLNETNAYYVLKDKFVEVVATESGKQPLTYQMRIGDRGPLYAFSAGKVALSFFSEPALKDYFTHVERVAHTSRTLCDETTLRRQLDEIRVTGIGYSRSELARGVVGTARAVVVNDALSGVLNVSVPEARIDDQLIATIRRRLTAATVELSTILSGWR